MQCLYIIEKKEIITVALEIFYWAEEMTNNHNLQSNRVQTIPPFTMLQDLNLMSQCRQINLAKKWNAYAQWIVYNYNILERAALKTTLKNQLDWLQVCKSESLED